MFTTPKEIPERLAELMVQAGITAPMPVWLRPQPVAGARDSECFRNAALAVRRAGGAVQHGWTIWEFPGKVLCAEFHAVHRTREGELRCVTLPCNREPRILFVPDPVRVYARCPVPNLRVVLDPTDAVIMRTAAFQAEYDALLVRYHDKSGMPCIPPKVLAELRRRHGIGG